MPISVRSRATGRVAMKPSLVDEYNMSMNEADQYTVYYAFVHKSRKWWRKLFFEVTLVNSYILYKISDLSPSTHFQFRQKIVDALASHLLSIDPPRSGPDCPSKRLRLSTGDPNHKQYYLQMRKQRECVVCSNTQQRKRKCTAYFCTVCPSQSSLCPVPCFGQFHQSLRQ